MKLDSYLTDLTRGRITKHDGFIIIPTNALCPRCGKLVYQITYNVSNGCLEAACWECEEAEQFSVHRIP